MKPTPPAPSVIRAVSNSISISPSLNPPTTGIYLLGVDILYSKVLYNPPLARNSVGVGQGPFFREVQVCMIYKSVFSGTPAYFQSRINHITYAELYK